MDRQRKARMWLEAVCPAIQQVTKLPREASFRQYYRVTTPSQQFIFMDAPPEKEPVDAFIAIAQRLRRSQLRAPEIIASDQKSGFILLEDFGSQQLFQCLTPATVDKLYPLALADLIRLQQSSHFSDYPLQHFDYHFMLNELKQFQEWFLQKHLGLIITPDLAKLLGKSFEILLESAVSQPQTIIHRDYHSRNLMHLDDASIGILDFQDAMIGPITYDAVSLLRDCYIAWPFEKVKAFALNYFECLHEEKLLDAAISESQFLRWFDLMGMQRHMKALFIFARKFYRDDNPDYLKEIPQTFRYVSDVSSRYEELHDFTAFIHSLDINKKAVIA